MKELNEPMKGQRTEFITDFEELLFVPVGLSFGITL